MKLRQIEPRLGTIIVHKRYSSVPTSCSMLPVTDSTIPVKNDTFQVMEKNTEEEKAFEQKIKRNTNGEGWEN